MAWPNLELADLELSNSNPAQPFDSSVSDADLLTLFCQPAGSMMASANLGLADSSASDADL